jgi:hypothetical protein
MIKPGKYTRFILSGPFIALLLICNIGFSQQSNVMYFMKGVPQINTLNPAAQAGYGFYLGTPGMAPFSFDFQNSPLRFHDLIFYNKSIDSVVTFLHPSADKRKFLSLLGSNNFIGTDVSTGIISMGFRINTMFFSIGISEKEYFRVNYPKDLFTLPMYGLLDKNLNPSNLDLSGIGVNASLYTEIALGVSKEINDLITVGVRGKILLGQANLYMKTTDIGIITNDSLWKFHSKVDLNASVPFLTIPKGTDGKYDIGTATMKNNLSGSDFLDAFLRKPNMGLAVDLGVIIKPMSWLTVSASVVDLGSIKWKNYSYNLKQDTSTIFRGADMTGIIKGDTTNIGEMLKDSVLMAFKKYNLRPGSYTTYLPTKLYIGATFNLWSDRISFGVLSMTEFYLKTVRQSFSISANIQPIRLISTSFSYSLLDNKYHDFGFGVAFKVGPFNSYYIFDYIPTSYDKVVTGEKFPNGIPLVGGKPININAPVYMRAFSMKIGMNLVFGGNRKKKALQDVPLIE